MNDTVEFLSSMSPKIRNKLKPGEHRFRRIHGVSILALKTNIRRSSLNEKSNLTMKNENLNIIECRISSESSEETENAAFSDTGSTQEEPVKNPSKSSSNDDDSIIVISDNASESSSDGGLKDNLKCLNLRDIKTEGDCELPQEKVQAIANWLEQINIRNNKSSSTIYTELSTINGSNSSTSCMNFIAKTECHAINSTFSQGHNKKFDEMFANKNNYKVKVDETASVISDDVVNDSLKNVVIEDSFEIVNVSLRSRLKTEKECGLKNEPNNEEKVENESTKEENKDIQNQVVEHDFVVINNDLRNEDSVDLSRKPGSPFAHEDNAAKILDELYGTSWRVNKDLVLSKTEPRKKIKKPSLKAAVVASESKPKTSLFYKNPYLDSEKSKTQNLLSTLSQSRMKETAKSSWLNRFRVLCDSDTNSENSPAPLRPTHLEFDDSSDEETSKYFKNNAKSRKSLSDKENRAGGNNKQKTDSSSNSDDNARTIKAKVLKNNTEKSQSSSGTSSFEKIQFVTTRKAVNNITSKEIRGNVNFTLNIISSDEDLTESIEPKMGGKVKPTVRKKQQISSSSNITSDNSDIVKTKPVVRRKQQINSSSSSTSDDIDKVKTKTDKKTSKKVSPNIETSSSSSTSEGIDKVKTKTDNKTRKKATPNVGESSSSISSDEEWNMEVSKIQRKVKTKDESYSFLASLSASVPILKCDMSARMFRNNFKAYKEQLVKKLFQLFNDKIFDNLLPQDMQIEWNDRMRSSAGFCYCKKITRRTGAIERSARIALSTKVLDTADRLRDTLIHEMCHAATWIVNCVSDGHGDYWKSWAFKAMKTFPELPNIKRCHNYVISTKYTYKCTTCGYSIGRHSKSLDIERKRCGYCYGKFEILINKTNKKGETKSVAATPKKEATGFALFVKENYGIFKTPDRKHGDVMKILGQKFQMMKIDIKP
ncbi:germ cell nuclear acidic protein-like [Diabrotica virgifera virgifera]|uniref:Uncharacterized protein LOC114326961 n=1 Tax=Diabrotica virgifera virgifera TaxID=50390 RepID=A0A6P7F6Y5_DIAVI|nr:germ cell nuclear acidic protein-like [Diabrotica virgifera virgifera]